MKSTKVLVLIALVIATVVVLSLLMGAIAERRAEQKYKINIAKTQTSQENGLALTIDEVSKHNSAASCWVIIENKVYDITSYLNSHPGGKSILAADCGRDATAGFATKGKSPGIDHSSTAKEILKSYYIADLNQKIVVKDSLSSTSTNGVGQVKTSDPSQAINPELVLSAQEVSKHNKAGDCWLIINNGVYDASAYVNSHPGGASRILNYCGKDATQGYNTKGRSSGSSHSSTADRILDSQYIGRLNERVSSAEVLNKSAALNNTNFPRGDEEDEDYEDEDYEEEDD